MRQDRTCKYCNTFFPNEEGKVFANHVRWCDKNLTNGDKGASKCSQKTVERFQKEFGEIKEYDVTCQRCAAHVIVKEREKRHPERSVYFCSRSCANSRGVRTKDFKQKVSSKLSGRVVSERITKTCESCNKNFDVTLYNKNKKYCSSDCFRQFRYKNVDKSGLKYYRRACSFKFNLADYPGEFDFGLVEQYGWYAAKNRGNNLDGVSRDHIISVKYGFENNVDVSIISHPANCRLMVHNSNVSKGKKCGMTLEQLQEKIKWWNEKYISRLG
jgi:hypothetical protein